VSPKLRVLAASQGGVFRRGQALARGHSKQDFRRRVSAKEWLQVRHGIYAESAWVALFAGSPFLAAAARRLAMGAETVISHETAAQLQGMELMTPYDGEPRLTVVRAPGHPPARVQGVYAAAVPPEHRDTFRGVPVTTAPRTAADCARSMSRHAAVVTVESALAQGLSRSAVLAVLEDCRGWPGARLGRDVVEFASERSETALESLGRCWFFDQSIPQPEQQRDVYTSDGRWVARVDFVWEGMRTVGELDGRTKYVDLDRDGSALWREKLREDRLRDLGLEVVRGYWSDGDDGGAALAERLRRAFARGSRAVGEPAYLIKEPPVRRPGPLSRAS
jgi:hypothetical protein